MAAARVVVTVTAPNPVWVGTDVLIAAAFTVAGVPTDPTVTTFRYRPGRNAAWVSLTGAQLTRSGVGLFSVSLPAAAGETTVEVIGTGAAAAVGVAVFEASRLP